MRLIKWKYLKTFSFVNGDKFKIMKNEKRAPPYVESGNQQYDIVSKGIQVYKVVSFNDQC